MTAPVHAPGVGCGYPGCQCRTLRPLPAGWSSVSVEMQRGNTRRAWVPRCPLHRWWTPSAEDIARVRAWIHEPEREAPRPAGRGRR